MESQKAYRPNVSFDYRGAFVWCHVGTVSPCGEWVEAGDTRWRMSAEWFLSEAAAKASKADEISAMAARLNDQALQLLQLAERPPVD